MAVLLDKLVKDAFDKYDVDRSGFIDKSEVSTLMDELGLVLMPKELDAAMAEMDKDGSGEVEYKGEPAAHSRPPPLPLSALS